MEGRAVVALPAHPASAQLVRVYATNSGGDAVSIIDPASHKTVASLNDIRPIDPGCGRCIFSLGRHNTRAGLHAKALFTGGNDSHKV